MMLDDYYSLFINKTKTVRAVCYFLVWLQDNGTSCTLKVALMPSHNNYISALVLAI